MTPPSPSGNDRPPVLMAPSPTGHDLPVIDVTNAAFAIEDTPEAMDALRRSYRDMLAQQAKVPKLLMKLLMWSAGRKSLMVRSLLQSETDFLGGLSTYAMKLGPDNLVPPFGSEIDRRMAGAPPLTSMRLRLQQVAHLAAEALGPELAARPSVPLHIINIGGGPAIDSLNTLLVLHRDAPDLLARKIAIHVLDGDDAGPAFGRNALAALQADGAALAGLDIAFDHAVYDWRNSAPLIALMDELSAGPAVIAASSEGALFEYGSDADIRANLTALYCAGHGARFIAGTVTRQDDLTLATMRDSRFALVPRGADGMAELAAGTGYSVVRRAEALISDQVVLASDGPARRR